MNKYIGMAILSTITITTLIGCGRISEEQRKERESQVIEEIEQSLNDKYGKKFEVIELQSSYGEMGTRSNNAIVKCTDDGIKFSYANGYDGYSLNYFADDIEEDLDNYVISLSDKYRDINCYGIYDWDAVFENQVYKENFFEMTPTEICETMLHNGQNIVVMPSSYANKMTFRSSIKEFAEEMPGYTMNNYVNTKGETRYELIYDTTAYEPKEDWLSLWFKD